MPTPTQDPRPEDILQGALDEATTKHFAHFNKLDWLPEWTDVTKVPVLKDNIKDPPAEPKKGPTPLKCVDIREFKERIAKLKSKYGDQLKHIDDKQPQEVEEPENSEKNDKLQKMPHPFSDFRHVDKGAFGGVGPAKFKEAIDALKEVEKLAKKDGELNKAIQGAMKPLGDAERLLAADPKGMQRLKFVFEWTLCQVTALYGEINMAISLGAPNGMSPYREARDRYIALLKDLDDHEPETKDAGNEPKSGVRGYGRAFKWAYILPLIHEGRIKGAKVIGKWNPHVSSSGIAIPH
jgi:hypothetical protein